MSDDRAPYYALTPDRVLDALQSTGLVPDGRLLPLASYENRVYQAGVEDSAPVVAKFYRPGRWSDAQILEEHGSPPSSPPGRSRWSPRSPSAERR